jgi:hypothetical protein
MKIDLSIKLALSIATLLLACEPAPTVTTVPETASQFTAPKTDASGQRLLGLVNACAKSLFPESIGVGGNALRYDAMTLNPYASQRRNGEGLYILPEPSTGSWHVRIEEEHPHNSIPNGVEFAVNPSTGACTRVIMD